MGEKGVKIISRMSRDDFYWNIIKGVAKSHEFSTLVVGGPAALTDDEKAFLRNSLISVGIDRSQLETDEDLADVATEIAGRSVTLK